MNCPYCKHTFVYSEAVKRSDFCYCPSCTKQVVYSLQIYPNEIKSWAKPTLFQIDFEGGE